jgi:hypothetical protein
MAAAVRPAKIAVPESAIMRAADMLLVMLPPSPKPLKARLPLTWIDL